GPRPRAPGRIASSVVATHELGADGTHRHRTVVMIARRSSEEYPRLRRLPDDLQRSHRRRALREFVARAVGATWCSGGLAMATYRGRFGTLMVVTISACTHAGSPAAPAAVSSPPPQARPAKIARLVALPAESATYPKLARAATDSLSRAQVDGLGAAQVSKVSLEVVQIAIECVDPSSTCYQAVGRSLTASGLLFAQIAAVK